MPIEVELPDGSVAEFPDGTAPDMIKRALSSRMAAVDTTGGAGRFAAPTGSLGPSRGQAPQRQQPATRSWSDVASDAVGNIPSSAAKFATDVVQPFLHPIETAGNLADVAAGGLRNAAGYVLPERAMSYIDSFAPQETTDRIDAKADAVGQHFKDRYGGVDALKNTIATDPVGFAGDASIVLTGGGSLAARAPAMGRVGQSVAATGRAIDPIGAAVRSVSGVGKLATGGLGMTTGVGSTPINAAFNAGRQGQSKFLEHARGTGDFREAVDVAEAAVNQMRQARGNAYNQGIASTKASQAVVDVVPTEQAIASARGRTNFKGIQTDPRAMGALDEVQKVVDQFNALPLAERTPEAFDALKRAVGVVHQSIDPVRYPNAAGVVGDVYKSIKSEIVRQVPEYAKTMGDYAEASEKLGEIRQGLGVGGKASQDTALRKLTGAMRNNVNTNYGARTAMVDELAKTNAGSALPAILAGQTMSAWHPRGLAALGPVASGSMAAATFNPAALAALPLASPRIVGEAAYGLGAGARVADSIGGALGGQKAANALGMGYATGNAARPVEGEDARARIVRSMAQRKLEDAQRRRMGGFGG